MLWTSLAQFQAGMAKLPVLAARRFALAELIESLHRRAADTIGLAESTMIVQVQPASSG